MAFFTVLSLGVGIAGVVYTAQVISKDKENDKEVEAAGIILDAASSWNTPMATELRVIVAATEVCPIGWEALFSVDWPGTDRGCIFED
jgi:hypothetical protein